MPRERYDLSFSIVITEPNLTTKKDIVDQCLRDALDQLIEQHVVEQWQVSADSTDLPDQTMTAAELMDMETEAMIAETRHPDDDLNPEPELPVDPRTQKDEPEQ